ncbi:MAG: phosphocholine cytidylyltransferase family protein [Myxococcota bacterium]
MNTTVIIPAAGQGTRLRPLTDNCPKCLVPLHGRPLLSWQLGALRQWDLQVGVVRGYLGHQIQFEGVEMRDNPDYSVTNMVRTIMCAEDLFGSHMIISYGDIVYEPSVIGALLRSQAAVSVVVDTQWLPYWQQRFDRPLDDAETLRLEGTRIMEIGGKATDLSQIEGQFIGLVSFRGVGLSWMRAVCEEAKRLQAKGQRLPGCPRGFDDLYTTDLLQALIAQGRPVQAVWTEGKWLEVDSVSDRDLGESLSHPTDEGWLSIAR